MEDLRSELNEINRGLMEELENIEKHYKNTSLFLETLLRRSHFDKGRLTLLTKKMLHEPGCCTAATRNGSLTGSKEWGSLSTIS